MELRRLEVLEGQSGGFIVVHANVNAPRNVTIEKAWLTRNEPCTTGIATSQGGVDGRGQSLPLELRRSADVSFDFPRPAVAREALLSIEPTYLDIELSDPTKPSHCLRSTVLGSAGAEATEAAEATWIGSPRWFVGAGLRPFLQWADGMDGPKGGWAAVFRAGTWIRAARLTLEIGAGHGSLPVAMSAVPFDRFPLAALIDLPVWTPGRLWLAAVAGYELTYWTPRDSGAATASLLHGPHLGLRIGHVPERLAWPTFQYRTDSRLAAVELYTALSLDGAHTMGWTAGLGLVVDIGWGQ